MHDYFHDLRNETLDVLPHTMNFMVFNPNIAEDLVRGIMEKMSIEDQLAFWWKCCTWIPSEFREELEDYLTRSKKDDKRVMKRRTRSEKEVCE